MTDINSRLRDDYSRRRAAERAERAIATPTYRPLPGPASFGPAPADRLTVQTTAQLAEAVNAFNRGVRSLDAIGRAVDATADLAGLIGVGTSSNILTDVDASRPVITLSNRLDNPNTKTFLAPRTTQRVTVTSQTETNALSSQKITVVGDTIANAVYGGFVTATEQDSDWSSPSFVDHLVAELAQAYAVQVEAACCTAVQNAITTNTVAAPAWTSSPSAVHAQLVNAAAAVRTSAKRRATHLFVGGTVWDELLALLGPGGLPLYPEFPNNVAGMTAVYSPGFSASFAAVGIPGYVDSFEVLKGETDLVNVQISSMDIAYRGVYAVRVGVNGFCGFA